jgi:hypothetical protein
MGTMNPANISEATKIENPNKGTTIGFLAIETINTAIDPVKMI